MTNKTSDLLTAEELQLLQQIIEQPNDDNGAELSITHASLQLLNALSHAEEISLVCIRQKEEQRFPFYFVSDGFSLQVKELGPADIIDHGMLTGLEGRYWRLDEPDGVKILDQQGENQLGSVVNISTSGLYIHCNPSQFQHIEQSKAGNDVLAFYLKVPNRGFHLIRAKIVRVESLFRQCKGLALSFAVDDQVALILHSYIIEKYDLIE